MKFKTFPPEQDVQLVELPKQESQDGSQTKILVNF